MIIINNCTYTHFLITGDVAAKRFKHLRDTFQKEKKKLCANMPSSGAGAEDRKETSTWEYYNDLLFLSEYITCRK